jgi:polyisoprenyl-phosphate glycosyltransferase
MMNEPDRAARKSRPQNFLLSLVVPCFNEEEVIGHTYDRVAKALGSREFRLQLIFVNDGSDDRTGDLLQRIAAGDSRVRVVTLSRNFGHQAAVSAGLAHAEGDAAAIIDADLQDPPEVILEMIERWREGYDVVYGIRRRRKETGWKRFCYALFYRLQRKIVSIDTPLDAGDFSLIDRRVLTIINHLPEKNRFFRGLRAWVGFEQIGIEYERSPRAAGVTKYPFLKLVKLAADGIFNFSIMPLTIVFYLGLTISLCAFLALALVIFLRVSNAEIFGVRFTDVRGFAATMVTILFIGGIQLVCMGILGEYVGRIYQEVKARPSFITKDDLSAKVMSSGEGGASRPPVPDEFETAGTANHSQPPIGQRTG